MRTIGYEILSRDEARRRIEPLTDRYGRQTIEPAVDELLAFDTSGAAATVQLRNEVRQLARGILGPLERQGTERQPSNLSAQDDASVPAQDAPNEQDKPLAVDPQTTVPAEACAVGSKPFVVPRTNPSTLKAVKLSRRQALEEFQQHLEERGLAYEKIDTVTRLKYTDKHLGALDFVIREAGRNLLPSAGARQRRKCVILGNGRRSSARERLCQ